MVPDHLQRYLSQLQTEFIMGGYIRCASDWCDYDYVPAYNKFYFIRGGECELVIDGQTYRPRRDQLFLMPAGVRQSYYNISEDCVLKYWCHFYAHINGTNLFDILKTGCFITVDNPSAMEKLFEKLLKAETDGSVASLLSSKAALLDILSYYIDRSGVDAAALSPRKGAPDFTPVLLYIENHLEQEISIGDLSEILHLHPNYFITCFKNNFGCPPIKYINRVRMEMAKHLLQTTDQTVSEIAGTVGFRDLFYFSRIFKKETGYSPTVFRGYRA